MGIYKVKDRRGRRRYVVSKYWPNGSGRLRKYAPNYRSAQALQTRVESSILDGTWKQLKQELAGGRKPPLLPHRASLPSPDFVLPDLAREGVPVHAHQPGGGTDLAAGLVQGPPDKELLELLRRLLPEDPLGHQFIDDRLQPVLDGDLIAAGHGSCTNRAGPPPLPAETPPERFLHDFLPALRSSQYR